MTTAGGEGGEVVVWDGADGGEEGFAHCVGGVSRARAWWASIAFDDVLPFGAVFEDRDLQVLPECNLVGSRILLYVKARRGTKRDCRPRQLEL